MNIPYTRAAFFAATGLRTLPYGFTPFSNFANRRERRASMRARTKKQTPSGLIKQHIVCLYDKKGQVIKHNGQIKRKGLKGMVKDLFGFRRKADEAVASVRIKTIFHNREDLNRHKNQ